MISGWESYFVLPNLLLNGAVLPIVNLLCVRHCAIISPLKQSYDVMFSS